MQYYATKLRSQLKDFYPPGVQHLDKQRYTALAIEHAQRLFASDRLWAVECRPTPESLGAAWMSNLDYTRFVLEELAYHQLGVTIHVHDTELLDTLAASSFDCTVGDIQLPFPVVEFAFPSGYMLDETEGWLMTGGLAVAGARTTEELKRGILKCIPNEVWDSVERMADQFDGQLVCSWLDPKTNLPKDDEMSVWLYLASAVGVFSSDHLLQIGSTPRRVNDSTAYDSFHMQAPADARFDHIAEGRASSNPLPHMADAMKARYLQMIGKLALYIQTEEYKSTLLAPARQQPRFRVGVSGGTAKALKRKKAFTLLNLFDKHTAEYGEANYTVLGNGHTVRPHLRKRHFRALRHPKYKRNANGSVRIIPVRATRIHASQTPEKHDRVIEKPELAR